MVMANQADIVIIDKQHRIDVIIPNDINNRKKEQRNWTKDSGRVRQRMTGEGRCSGPGYWSDKKKKKTHTFYLSLSEVK